MALEQASRDWTQELHNTAAKLTSTSRALELKFAQHVKTTAAEERCVVEPASIIRPSLFRHLYVYSLTASLIFYSDIPDPVKLVRRIHALEVAARQLQESCKEIAEKRKYLLPNVAQQQAGNSEVLDKVRHLLDWYFCTLCVRLAASHTHPHHHYCAAFARHVCVGAHS